MASSKNDRPQERDREKGVFLSWISLAIYLLIRLYVSTLRKSYVNCEPYRERYAREEGMLISFWHNQLLAMPFLYFGKPFGISTLVSLSKDGEITTRILRYWGIGSVRGSSHRGGLPALKELLRIARSPGHHIAMVPDGPTGPPFIVKDGILILAQKTGRPITPLAISYQRYFQLDSWDGFLIPYPFTKAYFVCGDPVQVPAKLDESEIKETRNRVTRALQDANALAMSFRTSKKGS